MKTQFDINRFKYQTWTLCQCDRHGSKATDYDNGPEAVAAWLGAKKVKGARFATLWGVTTTGHRQILKDWVK